MTRCTHSCRLRQTKNRLWRYRKRMGFTQEQVAAILGYISADHIAHWEHGRKLPSLLTALKLEIIYRVPVAFLFPELYDRLRDDLRAREERLRPTWASRRRGPSLAGYREASNHSSS